MSLPSPSSTARPGTVPKLAAGTFSSTRASATAPNVADDRLRADHQLRAVVRLPGAERRAVVGVGHDAPA